MGLEARDFSEKNFLEKSKSLCYLSCALRLQSLGGLPSPRPIQNGKIGQKAMQAHETTQNGKCTHERKQTLKQPYKPSEMNLGTVWLQRYGKRCRANVRQRAKGQKGQKDKSMTKWYGKRKTKTARGKSDRKRCKVCNEQKRAAAKCCNHARK